MCPFSVIALHIEKMVEVGAIACRNYVFYGYRFVGNSNTTSRAYLQQHLAEDYRCPRQIWFLYDHSMSLQSRQ